MAWKASPGYAAIAALAISLGVAAFAACATGNTGDETDPVAKACEVQSNCEQSGAAGLQSCTDDLSGRRGEAKEKNCGDEFDTYVSCLLSDGECVENTFDDSACAAADSDLSQCQNPKPTDGGTGDGGDGGACLSCTDYLNAGGVGDVCESAAQAAADLKNCACNIDCSIECMNDLCNAVAPTMPGSTCSTCLQDYCLTQYTTCISLQ